MKEKIKKFFSKDNLFILICTLLIGLFVLLGVLFYRKDVNSVNDNKQSNINLVDNDFNVYLNDSSNSHNNTLSFIPLNYYESISLENFAFDSGVLSEGYCDVGAFYISNRDLFYTYRNAFYIDDTQPNVYLNFSLDYKTDLIDNDFSFNVPLWVNYEGDFLSRSDLIDYLESIGSSYSSSTTFKDNSSLQTTINFSIDITEYIKQYSYFQNNTQFPEKKIVFYILTRFADARYDSSDCTINIGLDYNFYNLWSFGDVSVTSSSGETWKRTERYLTLEPGTYTFSVVNNSDFNYILIGVGDLTLVEGENKTYTFTLNDNALVNFYFYASGSLPVARTVTYSNIMLNKGFNIIPYQPYFYSFSFTDWCASHSFSVSNYSNDSYLAYDTLNSRYNTLLNDYNNLNNDYDNLDNSYNSLNSNYNSLLQQYNDLANNEYTFSELFWSISSVPFGVLASGFNVNVLGVNLAAIITGLFTALLIIWLIKKFLK